MSKTLVVDVKKVHNKVKLIIDYQINLFCGFNVKNIISDKFVD